MTICTLCGAFADKQTVLLTNGCRGSVNKRGKSNLKRVFDDHLHPVHNLAVPTATFWRKCAGAQDHADPDGMLLLDALGDFFDSGALHHPRGDDCFSSQDVDMPDLAPPVSCSTEGAGEVSDNDSFAFGDDSFRDDAPAGSDLSFEPVRTSPLVIHCSSSSAIAAALDLGDEAIKRAFYDATAADDTKYSDAVSGEVPSSSNGGPCSALARAVPKSAPSRQPNVLICETSSLR